LHLKRICTFAISINPPYSSKTPFIYYKNQWECKEAPHLLSYHQQKEKTRTTDFSTGTKFIRTRERYVEVHSLANHN